MRDCTRLTLHCHIMDENTRTCIESKFFTFRPTSADGPGDVFLLYKNSVQASDIVQLCRLSNITKDQYSSYYEVDHTFTLHLPGLNVHCTRYYISKRCSRLLSIQNVYSQSIEVYLYRVRTSPQHFL